MQLPEIRQNHFNLREFSGSGYDKGRGFATQVLWLIASRNVVMHWWLPNRLRIALLRLFGAQIGRGVLLRHDVKIHWPWKLEIGDHTWVGEGTWILNLEKVTIGSNTCVSQDVLLCTGSHDRRSPTFEFDNAPITIGDSVWVAARATVLRGVQIGDGATIGATTLVTRSVQPGHTVVAAQR
ncbi:putative colanic acid biosynthesis acetyltransferase [Mycobacterium sp. C31M]